MAVTIPGHIFAELPLFDIADDADTVIIDLHNRPDLVNIRGALQGGLVATLVDIAAGRLAMTATGTDHGVSTADMTIHYLTPIISGPARAVAKIVRTGKNIIVVAVDVHDIGSGRLAARATLSFAVLRPRAADQQAVP